VKIGGNEIDRLRRCKNKKSLQIARIAKSRFPDISSPQKIANIDSQGILQKRPLPVLRSSCAASNAAQRKIVHLLSRSDAALSLRSTRSASRASLPHRYSVRHPTSRFAAQFVSISARRVGVLRSRLCPKKSPRHLPGSARKGFAAPTKSHPQASRRRQDESENFAARAIDFFLVSRSRSFCLAGKMNGVKKSFVPLVGEFWFLLRNILRGRSSTSGRPSLDCVSNMLGLHDNLGGSDLSLLLLSSG